MRQWSFWSVSLLLAGLCAGPLSAAEPNAAAFRLDQKEYSPEEPFYLLAPTGAFACGQETILRLRCVECKEGAADCACKEKRVNVPCRLLTKSGSTEVWEFPQRLKAGHYRLRIKGLADPKEFYVRNWPGQPPVELDMDTDRQIYSIGEDMVLTLHNESGRDIRLLEGCFRTPIRFYELPPAEPARRPHACVATLPQAPGIAAVIHSGKKLEIHLRVPDAPNSQLTAYVEFQRAATLWEYGEEFGTLDPNSFRGSREANPILVLPKE